VKCPAKLVLGGFRLADCWCGALISIAHLTSTFFGKAFLLFSPFRKLRLSTQQIINTYQQLSWR